MQGSLGRQLRKIFPKHGSASNAFVWYFAWRKKMTNDVQLTLSSFLIGHLVTDLAYGMAQWQ